jgi:hypothetical protein
MLLPPALGVWAVLSGFADVQAKSLHPDYRLMRGEVQQYGDWLVGCDNAAACTIVGFPKPIIAVDSDGPPTADMAVRISFAGTDGTPPVVEILPIGYSSEASTSVTHTTYRFKLSLGSRQLEPLYNFTVTILNQTEADFLLHALEKGLKLAGVDEQTGNIAIRFPADRYKTALLAMGVQRAALQKQIADEAIDNLPGELPDGSTMPVPGKLKRITAVETIVSGFVPILVDGRCRNDFMTNPRQYHFANGAILWSFECSKASGDTRTLWDMAPEANAIAAPLNLPEPRDGTVRAGVDGLEGVIFDWDFGILRSYDFLNGREDCGTFRAWGYTQNGWHLIERREMPLCKGLSPDQWIRTHYIPTDGAGPDE